MHDARGSFLRWVGLIGWGEREALLRSFCWFSNGEQRDWFGCAVWRWFWGEVLMGQMSQTNPLGANNRLMTSICHRY